MTVKKTIIFIAIAVFHNFGLSTKIYTNESESGTINLTSYQESEKDQLIANNEIPAQEEKSLKFNSKNSKIDEIVLEASVVYQLPASLIHAIISVESNYNLHAVSPKGAQGLMQLMPATGQRFGAVNFFDPKENIFTGSKYLRWLLDYFQQDLKLSIAAYNAGEGSIVRAGRKIPQFLETQKYVNKVFYLYQKFQYKAAVINDNPHRDFGFENGVVTGNGAN